MDTKAEVKEESCLLNFCLQNEGELCSNEFGNKVKDETITSGSDCALHIKTEIDEEAAGSSLGSFNSRENSVMKYNKSNRDCKIETKKENEEQWMFQTSMDTIIIDDDSIKNETPDKFYSITSPRLYKEGVSSYMPNVQLQNYISPNMTKDSPECEGAVKENDITDISLIEVGVNSETPQDVNMASSKFFHQSKTNTLDIVKEKCNLDSGCEYIYDVSENSSECLSNLKKRRMIHGRKEEKKCNLCEKTFNHLSSLKRHKMIHEGKVLEKSNTTFTYFPNRNTHKFPHKNQNSHKCNICNKGFAQLQYLKIHKLIHEGIKPHKCNMFDKAFADLSNLKSHKLIHEGIKAHKCSICNKTFTRLSSLKRHTLIHDIKKQQ